MQEALESRQWRAFRLFLSSIEDEELKEVRGRLNGERAARRVCEKSAMRLFFSSLTSHDLELARQTISKECAARRQEKRAGALSAAITKSRRTAAG